MTESTTAHITISAWLPGDRDADFSDIARLITELGYPCDAATQRDRLARMMAVREVVPIDLLVARDAGEIVGLASVSALDVSLGESATAELRALVVLESRRGQRIGERLVHATGAWAREHGAETLILRTRATRTDAHRFYERLGFTQAKSSRTYKITLN